MADLLFWEKIGKRNKQNTFLFATMIPHGHRRGVERFLGKTVQFAKFLAVLHKKIQKLAREFVKQAKSSGFSLK